MERSRIFIVDDEQLVAKNTQHIINTLGYDCLGFETSGDEAIKKIEELRPDLVLVDINLSGLKDGIEVAETVHRSMNVPVIFVSAHSNADILERIKSNSTYGYVIKPFSGRELSFAIELALFKFSTEQTLKQAQQELASTNRELLQSKTNLETKINSRTSELLLVNQALKKVLLERKKAETELKQSEEEYRGLFENANDCIIIVNPVTEEILNVNQKACDIFGYKHEEFIKSNFSDIARRPMDKECLAQLSRNKNFKSETYYYSKTGEKMLMEANANTVNFKRKKAVLIIIRDLTQQKQTEKNLAEKENKYRTIAESLPQIIFEADESGKLTYINKVGLSILEYSMQDFEKGINMMDLISDEYKNNLFEDARKQIDGMDIHGNEYWAVKKSGEGFPIIAYTNKIVDERESFKGFRGIMLDVSEGQKAQTEIKKLFNIIQQSADNVIIADSSGVIEYANPSLVRSIGYSLQEMLGKKFSMFHTEEFDERYFAELIKILGKGDVYRSVFTHKKKSGEIYYEEKAITPIIDKKGVLTHFVTTGRDISERIKAEEILRQSERKFRSLVQNVTDITTLLDEEGRIQYQSPSFYRLFGYEESEVLNEYAFDFIHPEDVSNIKRFFNASLQISGSWRVVEFRFKKKNGAWVYLDVLGENLLHDESIKAIVINSRDITEKKINEKHIQALAKLQEAQKEKERRIRSLSLLKGQEEERRRLSREIHDGLGQMLTAIKLNIENISFESEAIKAIEEKKANNLKDLIKNTIAEARRISHDLMPTTLFDFGLVSSIKNLIEEFSKTSNIKIHFAVGSEIERFESNIETTYFRIIQESINNIVKHAKAKNIHISIKHIDNKLKMSIQDDGVGFNLGRMSSFSGGYKLGNGIYNMRERAKLVGADFKISSNPNEGVLIDVELPTSQKMLWKK